MSITAGPSPRSITYKPGFGSCSYPSFAQSPKFCGSKAHSAAAGNSPSGFRQSGCLLLHFAKSHNEFGTSRSLRITPTAGLRKKSLGRNDRNPLWSRSASYAIPRLPSLLKKCKMTQFLYRFQIKDEIKAARIEATKAYSTYVEEPKTSQRR